MVIPKFFLIVIIFYFMSANFIEIIISLCLISIMLLGLDAVQLTSLREAKIAHFYAIAQRQINNMAEYLTQNKKANNEMISEWNKQNASVLPNGIGVVNEYGKNYQINIFWGDRDRNDCLHNTIGISGCLQLSVNNGELF